MTDNEERDVTLDNGKVVGHATITENEGETYINISITDAQTIRDLENFPELEDFDKTVNR